MSLTAHDAPGLHTDLTEANQVKWSAKITSFMNGRNISPTLTPQFYDATKTTEGPNAQSKKVSWSGFPKIISNQFPNNERRWTEADKSRGVQDEYLEWSVKKDTDGKILKVVFCNEGPEYMQFLGKTQPETLIKLYQDLHPDAGIQPEDLFKPGPKDELLYEPRNKWNNSTDTGTIMHLIQRNNTLAAEVDLIARATVSRKGEDGTIISDRDHLIRCSGNGNKDRNSDPTIGAAVNSIARGGNMVTLENPVGLYIDSVNVGQIQPPDDYPDEDVNQFFKFTRGAENWRTRLEFEVPKDKGFALGDCYVSGQPLRFGSQLADLILVSASVRTFTSNVQPEARPCGAPPPVTGLLSAESDREDGLEGFESTR